MEGNQNNIKKRKDGLWEARYKNGRYENGKLKYASCYGKTREEAKAKRDFILNEKLVKENEPIGLSLLILGAGSHGQEVKEIAELTHCFSKIGFLDDDAAKSEAIGDWSMAERLQDDYCAAIVAVGNENKRRLWMSKLAKMGYSTPTLIHPSAIISSNSIIGAGTVVCARATISPLAQVGKGCIISAGVTIARSTIIEDWTYVDVGGVVKTIK